MKRKNIRRDTNAQLRKGDTVPESPHGNRIPPNGVGEILIEKFGARAESVNSGKTLKTNEEVSEVSGVDDRAVHYSKRTS